MSSQTQGDTVRVTSKKRDDLQTVMQALREADLGIPIQFDNRAGLSDDGLRLPASSCSARRSRGSPWS